MLTTRQCVKRSVVWASLTAFTAIVAFTVWGRSSDEPLESCWWCVAGVSLITFNIALGTLVLMKHNILDQSGAFLAAVMVQVVVALLVIRIKNLCENPAVGVVIGLAPWFLIAVAGTCVVLFKLIHPRATACIRYIGRQTAWRWIRDWYLR